MSNGGSTRDSALPVGDGHLFVPARWTARAVNRSFLLELERDKTAQRAERMKKKQRMTAVT